MSTIPQYGDYQQTFGDSGYNEFKRLESQFAGAFGGSFPQFSYDAYLNDTDYAQRIRNQIGGEAGPQKQQALDDLIAFFKRQFEQSEFEKAGGAIDVESIWGKLREGVEGRADEGLQHGQAEISRLTAAAERRAREAAAGTGLASSGAFVGGLHSIGNKRTDLFAKLQQKTSLWEQETLAAIDEKITNKQHEEQYLARGMNYDQAQQANQLRNQMKYMQMEFLYAMSAEDQKGFWDSWGGILEGSISAIGTIGGAIVGGPPGAAAGASIGKTTGDALFSGGRV